MKHMLLIAVAVLLVGLPIEVSSRQAIKHHAASAQTTGCSVGGTPPTTGCGIGDMQVGGALSSTDAIAICQQAGGCPASATTWQLTKVPLLPSIRGGLSAVAPLSYNSSTGAFSLGNTTVTPGSYTNTNLTVNAQGQITAASNGTGGTGGGISGPGTTTNGFVPQWSGTTGSTLSVGLPVGTTGNSTIVETSPGGLIANSLISGLPNANLANSSITLNTHSLVLGGTLNLAYSDLGAFATNNAIPKGNGTALVASSLTDNGTTVSTTEAAQVASLQVTNQAGTGVRCIHADAAGNQSAASGDCATGGSGSVTTVTAGTGLNVGAGPGGAITTTGTLNLANTAVAAGSYTSANITVDAQGRLTSAANGGAGAPAFSAITGGTNTTAAMVVGSGASIASSGGPITATAMPASGLTGGPLAAAMMPAYTGDVTSTAGTTANTIAANAVTNAKSAQMAANTIKGNPTGALANAADMAVPSCADTAGNHLNWTSGTGLSCGTTSSGGAGITMTASTPNMVVTGSPGTTLTVGTTAPTNPQAGASYTVVAGDVTKTVLMNSATATTVAVPQATGSFGNGFAFDIQTGAAGSTTTSTTSTVNGVAGATGIKMGAQQTTAWLSDGTNWRASLGLPQPATQTGTTFLRDDMTWQAVGGASTSSPNTWTAAQTFGQVNGATRVVTTGTTDTLLATDCGKTVYYSLAAFTVTIPASIVPASGTKCVIMVVTTTANKVTVTGTAVTAATLVSADSYTGTQNIAGSGIVLELTTIASATDAFLYGHGS